MAATMDIDLRAPCMYGEQCYRKNPDHLNKYKHPPKRKAEPNNTNDDQPAAKKLCRKANDEFVVPDIPQSIVDAVNSAAQQRIPICEDGEEGKPYEPSPEVVHEDYPVTDSPTDIKLSIEQKFLLEMPEDFFHLWDLCTNLNKEKPEEALIKAGLTLVGPYDLLTGKLKGVKKRTVSTYLCHWRYYYDPPEFMTIVAGSENEFHLGYYRDDPFAMPNFVASMSNLKPGVVTPTGENIFAALCNYLTNRMKQENPFKKFALQRLHKEVEDYAIKRKLPLEVVTPDMKARRKEVVARTFNTAGIVVPVNDEVGYRPIPESDANLRKMLRKVVESTTEVEKQKNFEALHEIITNVQFATDEGDFGMGLELGLDLFAFGGEVFHKSIFHLLSVAYELLGREPYIDIIQAHLKNRRRGSNLSILEVVED